MQEERFINIEEEIAALAYFVPDFKDNPEIAAVMAEISKAAEKTEDEAFASYVDMVGFDDNDDEETEAVQCFKFNGKKAYGFSAHTEDEEAINVFCQEPKKGICVLFSVTALDFRQLDKVMQLIERGFRLG